LRIVFLLEQKTPSLAISGSSVDPVRPINLLYKSTVD